MAPEALFNLQEFDRVILGPTRHLFARRKRVREEAYSFAQIVSCYFWLLLGVETEYFPDKYAEALFSQRFFEFINTGPDLLSKWGYIFDTEFVHLLGRAVSVHDFIRRAREVAIQPTPAVRCAVRSALTAEAQIVGNEAATEFLAFLNFEPNTLRASLSSGFQNEEGTLGSEIIVSGFQATLNYMDALVGLARTIRGDKELEFTADRLNYRIRQLTRWRVNRHAAGTDHIFTEVAEFLNKTHWDNAADESQLLYFVTNLLGEWGYTHEKATNLGA